jgi:hypothetical protein
MILSAGAEVAMFETPGPKCAQLDRSREIHPNLP